MYNKEIIKNYEWIIHFEPRLQLINPDFINSALQNPRNLFTLPPHPGQFNTGLFCCKTSLLLDFSLNTDLKQMCLMSVCIETALFEYFKNIDYDILPKMGVIRHDVYNNVYLEE